MSNNSGLLVKLKVTGTYVTWGNFDNPFERVIELPATFLFGDIVKSIPEISEDYGYNIEKVEVVK